MGLTQLQRLWYLYDTLYEVFIPVLLTAITAFHIVLNNIFT